jgi:hypothetical protein
MTHGIIDAVEQAGAEVIPSVFLSASSGGRVADSVMELAKETVRKCLEENGPVDAVCVDLHGATCTESADDVLIVYVHCKIGLGGAAFPLTRHNIFPESLGKILYVGALL